MQYIINLFNNFCLFPYHQQLHKKAIPLTRYITLNCNTTNKHSGQKHNQQQMVKVLCQNLEIEEKGEIARWIRTEKNKKVLLLDLDKTLIYYNHSTNLVVRPYLKQFLEELKKCYSIYIFTSATRSYVKQIFQKLKQLRIDIRCIKGILSRQNCIKISRENEKNIYVKELSVLPNVSLSDIVLLDDLPISYCLNADNGLSIHPFQGDLSDCQLRTKINILKEAAQFEDIRQYLSTIGKEQLSYASSL